MHDLSVKHMKQIKGIPISVIKLGALAGLGSLALIEPSFGQVVANGLGAQVQATSNDATSALAFVGSGGMYVGALFFLILGVIKLRSAFDPNTRDPGTIGFAAASIVLCGILAGGGSWVGKASQSTTGGAATVTSTNAAIAF
jgi:hypothetical protein